MKIEYLRLFVDNIGIDINIKSTGNVTIVLAIIGGFFKKIAGPSNEIKNITIEINIRNNKPMRFLYLYKIKE
ncbi:hypothetical protein PROTEUSMB838_19070 [Proteus sp. MB838]